MFCGWCGQYMHDLPSFLIARNCLCYNCAKLAYLHLEPIAGVINNQSKEKHQAVLKQHQNWQKAFLHHRYNKGIIQRLIEFFSGNKSSYEQLFLKDNPEPETSILPPIIQPVLCPEQSPFIGRNTTRNWILKRDRYECQICGTPDVLQSFQIKIKSQLEVHHIIPKASSGGNNRTNLITLCVECHNAEKWFGHVRAFVDVNAYEQCVEWSWDLMPDFLISTDQELLKDQQLFCKQTSFKSHDAWLEYRTMLDDTNFVIDI